MSNLFFYRVGSGSGGGREIKQERKKYANLETKQFKINLGQFRITVIWVEYLVPLGNTEKGHF